MDTKNSFEITPTKKATNKDVAKLAGVSVATVSYVLNGRAEMRIADATKKKVMQAINFLNYSPNPYAVGLSANQAHNIIFRSPETASELFDFNVLFFINSLLPLFKAENYCVSFSQEKTAEKLNASACVCVGFSPSEFRNLANENFIPLVAIDSVINDPIFYQISPDFTAIASSAEMRFNNDYCYISLETNSAEIKSEMLSAFKTCIFIRNFNELTSVIQNNKNLVFSQPVFSYLLPSLSSSENYLYYDLSHGYQSTLIQSVLNAINRIKKDDDAHFIKV